MSAIAVFRLIETSKLNELRENAEIRVRKKFFRLKLVDNYNKYLDSNSKRIKDFIWSGYIFGAILIFLKEKKGIDLSNGKYDDIANAILEKRKNSILILTVDHKRQHLDKLNPDKFTVDELMAFNKELSESAKPELVEAEIEGIKALRDSLELLTDDSKVVLFSVG